MKHLIFLIPAALIVGGVFGYLIGNTSTDGLKDSLEEDLPTRQSGYSFINPLLECENNGSFARQKYIPFEKEAKRKIENYIEKNTSGALVSVYFRNLNNGPWFGIREDERFAPASLMKVTLFMSYMKWAEEDPSLFEKKIVIQGIDDLYQVIAPEKKLIVGNEYTIKELLFATIVYSDNLASYNLLISIPPERQNKTFIDLGIPPPNITKTDYTLSVKEYASFFRILYNSSYLSNPSSESALNLLSQSAYKDALVAGVGSGIAVAHKFGEREYLSENGEVLNQLHDCGIVYHPNYPYLICIMTRSKEGINSLSFTIKNISEIIYDEINLRYPYK